jgi:hypothetical protein
MTDPYGTGWLWDDAGELAPQPAAAAADRDHGMALALAADDVTPWPQRAREWITALPPGTELTAELLTAAVGLPRDPGPNRNNAVGAAVRAAATAGLLVKVGHTTATRKRSHARVLTVWARTLEGHVS